MSNVKNSVAEYCATGAVTVSSSVTISGATELYNATFLAAFGAASVSVIPVTFISGNDWQTCKVTWDGTDTLTIDSIQSTFVSGVYDDTSPAGITLTGTPRVQVTLNAEMISVLDSKVTSPDAADEGSITIANAVGLTQAEYDASVKNANTLYVVPEV